MKGDHILVTHEIDTGWYNHAESVLRTNKYGEFGISRFLQSILPLLPSLALIYRGYTCLSVCFYITFILCSFMSIPCPVSSPFCFPLFFYGQNGKNEEINYHWLFIKYFKFFEYQSIKFQFFLIWLSNPRLPLRVEFGHFEWQIRSDSNELCWKSGWWKQHWSGHQG